MGIEILPWEEGDELKCEVFTVTSDTPWKPKQFKDMDMPIDPHEYQPEMMIAQKTSLFQSSVNNIILTFITSLAIILELTAIVLQVFTPSKQSDPITLPDKSLHFDPNDDEKLSFGSHVKLILHEPGGDEVDALLNCMTQRELCGCDDHDGWCDGHPEANFNTSDCVLT